MPSASDPMEEQREPHFLNGKSRVNAMDYEGAIESFEKALEVNPRSSSAHFELGLLYEDKEQDYAAAIYHYEKFLKLRPNSDNADIIRQRIISDKQELAKAVSLAPLQQNMQRDLERQADEIRDLRQKLDAWQSYYAARGMATPPDATLTSPNTSVSVQRLSGSSTAQAATTSGTVSPAPTPSPARAARQSGRIIGTYAIKSGDTPAAVARKYGVKLDALLAVNPNLDARHLKIGQTLNIPAP